MSCANAPTQGDETELMPRRRQVKDKTKCARCKASRSLYILRNVTFCQPCFESAMYHRFVRSLHPPMAQPGHRGGFATRPPLQPGGVLLALSGGAGSTTMLDLVDQNTYVGREGEVRDIKKGQRTIVWAHGWAVHVDYSSVTGMQPLTERLREMAEARNLRFVALRAEDAFDPTLRDRLRALAGGRSEDDEDTPDAKAVPTSGLAVNLAEPDLALLPGSSSSPLESLTALLTALPPPSRPALLARILEALVTFTARTLPNISHVLVGETSTREAQRMIAATASGRGWALPLELAVVRPIPDAPSPDYEGVDSQRDQAGPSTALSGENSGQPNRAASTEGKDPIIRIKAMKDLTVKEAALFCRGRGLPTINERRWDGTVGGAGRDARGKGATASLEALTERFIAGLNVTHPSTVSTINKTGGKLKFAGEEGLPLCPVCQYPVDPSAIDWKARTSLTSLPGRGIRAESNPDSRQSPPCTETTATGEPITPSPSARPPLAPLLCYACLTDFTPLTAAQRDRPASAATPLPLWVGERVAERAPQPTSEHTPREVTRDEMRAEIDAFLISE